MRHIPTVLSGQIWLCFTTYGYAMGKHRASLAVIRHLPMQNSTVHCENIC